MSKPGTIVLLVEDEPMISELYRSVFTQQQYVVVVAYNKTSALHLIERHRPTVIMLDLMIPIGPGETLVEYDHPVGFDILEWMQHHPELSTTKVVVITNMDSEENKQRAQDLGAAMYLVKSNVEPHDIVRRVDSLIG